MNTTDMQKTAKDQMDTAMKAMGTATKGMQAIAAEMNDYTKKSFEQGTAAMEKIFGAKTLDKAVEAQTDYVKSAFEGAVAQMTKMNALYTEMFKDFYKPYEGVFSKAMAK